MNVRGPEDEDGHHVYNLSQDDARREKRTRKGGHVISRKRSAIEAHLAIVPPMIGRGPFDLSLRTSRMEIQANASSNVGRHIQAQPRPKIRRDGSGRQRDKNKKKKQTTSPVRQPPIPEGDQSLLMHTPAVPRRSRLPTGFSPAMNLYKAFATLQEVTPVSSNTPPSSWRIYVPQAFQPITCTSASSHPVVTLPPAYFWRWARERPR
jgi:hypothetical protein